MNISPRLGDDFDQEEWASEAADPAEIFDMDDDKIGGFSAAVEELQEIEGKPPTPAGSPERGPTPGSVSDFERYLASLGDGETRIEQALAESSSAPMELARGHLAMLRSSAGLVDDLGKED